jgi:cyclopropane fatty-acyl-phospholipid synthase-like methyltransferase
MPQTTRRRKKPRLTAATADRHVLYGLSVQNVEAEIDFVDDTFKDLRGRRAEVLREDFCGTANTSCEWVKRRPRNRAIGVDLCSETLAWAEEHNLAKLRPAQRERVTLLNRNVLDPGPKGRGVDAVLAMNFSYWIFMKRAEMLAYFRSVRESLAPGGIFFLDHYGGSDALKEIREKRPMEGFTYVWDQHKYNSITGEMVCYIHFEFPDGSKMRRAFEYRWRHWTLPEIRDILDEAGFTRNTVYWEEEDDEGEGTGEYYATEDGAADLAFITYIVAEP